MIDSLSRFAPSCPSFGTLPVIISHFATIALRYSLRLWIPPPPLLTAQKRQIAEQMELERQLARSLFAILDTVIILLAVYLRSFALNRFIFWIWCSRCCSVAYLRLTFLPYSALHLGAKITTTRRSIGFRCNDNRLYRHCRQQNIALRQSLGHIKRSDTGSFLGYLRAALTTA